MFKKWVIQVNFKTTSKTDIGWFPFDRICHVQCSPSLQRLWALLRNIDMNDLQEQSHGENEYADYPPKLDEMIKSQTWSLLYLIWMFLCV